MWRERLKIWKTTYGQPVFLALCFLLVGALSFEAGLLKAEVKSPEPLIIRTPALVPEAKQTEKVMNETNTAPIPEAIKNIDSQKIADASNCVFVGSKNSNKYHDPNSRCAKQIKPANRVCFVSKEEATQRGYIPGCLQ